MVWFWTLLAAVTLAGFAALAAALLRTRRETLLLAGELARSAEEIAIAAARLRRESGGLDVHLDLTEAELSRL